MNLGYTSHGSRTSHLSRAFLLNLLSNLQNLISLRLLRHFVPRNDKLGQDFVIVSAAKQSQICRILQVSLLLIILLATVQGNAVELNVARQGEVKNVPLQAPYNGCLIVREGPGMDSPVKGNVVNGDTVTIEATSGSWYKISAPLSGYVWSSYIAVTESQSVDTTNMTKPVDLETIVNNANPETRDQKLPERQQLLERNQVIEINIDQEMAP